MKGLIVCRTGMGSSLMLKIKAQKRISFLGQKKSPPDKAGEKLLFFGNAFPRGQKVVRYGSLKL